MAVRLQCEHCRVAISYPPDEWKPTSLECPNCKVTLITPVPGSKELMALGELANALKILRSAKDLKFTVRLEFDRQDR